MKLDIKIYPENEIDWNIGDIVIHDADAKTKLMLMKVVEINSHDGLIKTVYINRKGEEPYYLNDKKFLLAPELFGMEVKRSKK